MISVSANCPPERIFHNIGFELGQPAESEIRHEVVAAIDVNTTANKIYSENFPTINLMDCGIESLKVHQLDSMKIDMILMSPPCQPFTRVGKKQDTKDIRTNSFLHLLQMLPRLNHCPSYILVENVKGFEKSETRDKLIDTLKTCNFTFQEFMLSPLQFGIPNSRLRYYLIAKKEPSKFPFTSTEELMTEIPACAMKWLKYRHRAKSLSSKSLIVDPNNTNTSVECSSELKNAKTDVNSKEERTKNSDPDNDASCSKSEDKASLSTNRFTCRICKSECLQNYAQNMRQENLDNKESDTHCLPIMHFLEEKSASEFECFCLSRKDLKRFIVMDIVLPCMKKSTCFTKRYGHFMEGAGSVVQITTNVQAMERASLLKDEALELQNRDQWGDREYSILEDLKLRYFTPTEIANLLCFPDDYRFPKDLSNIQLYRCLGNSLNVHVVSVLIRLLTIGDSMSNGE